MLKGTNLEHARVHNLRTVLETVRLSGPISRAEVARRTNLTAQTISNLMTQLLDQGLVVESGRRQGRRGRASIELELNAQGAFAIGLDLDREHLTGVLVDLAGTVHERFHRPLKFPSPDEAIALMASVVDTLAARVEPQRLWGVGVGFPGPLRIRDGQVDNVANPDSFPGWDNVSVADRLRRHIDLPILLENNATAAAIGESFYGAGQDIDDFVYVFLGVGLGGGLMFHSRPYRGFQGNAGEIGFLPISVEPSGVERLGKYFQLPVLYQTLAEDGVSVTTPADLAPLFEARQPTLVAWLDEAALHLAPALAAGEFFIDPEAIIFGGSWPPALIDHLIQRLERLLPPLRLALKPYQPRLIRTEAGEDAAALGVATLPIHALLSPFPTTLAEDGRGTLEHPLALIGRR